MSDNTALTNRQILDQAKQRELTLELLSFSGGENTKGEDHELAANEARNIQNWDTKNLGGMIRAKGFTKVADGASAIFDATDTHHVVTAQGTAALSTATKKFGEAALALDGDSDSLSMPDSTDWDVFENNTDEWTIDFWVKHTDNSGFEYYCSQFEDTNNRWDIHHDHGNGIKFRLLSGGSTVVETGYGGEITDTDWHHVCAVKVDDEFGVYLDGTQVGYVQDTSTDTLAGSFFIGQGGDSNSWFDGSIDEFRVNKSNVFTAAPVVGLSDTITIPTATSALDANTKLLLNFDGYQDSPLDLGIEHFEGTTTEVYGIIDGDLVKKSTTSIVSEDDSAFTTDILSHAVSAGSALWITNSTDNLQRKTIGNPIAAAAGQPSTATERVYEHSTQRLIAEGGGTAVFGSRVGIGNWNSANSWSASNDAWNIVMPDITQGAVMGFPSGPELTVFTKFDTYVISNQPAVRFRRVTNGIGCSLPYSVAKGNEGIFFISEFPTKGVFLWDSVNYVWLTEKHDFVDCINFSNRVFGIYKDRKYFLFYNETGSGVNYTNRLKVYDTRFGRWMSRPVNGDLADNFGYPWLLTKSNNKLYSGSSRKGKIYELEDTSTSDNTNNTEANYETKNFSSRDFSLASGGAFPIDNVRMKLTRITAVTNGSAGDLTVKWTSNRGLRSGSQIFPLTAVDGDLINTTFIVNTSSIISFDNLQDKRVSKTFNNTAVGREFSFEIVNNGTGLRTEVKRLKIHAIALDEV